MYKEIHLKGQTEVGFILYLYLNRDYKEVLETRTFLYKEINLKGQTEVGFILYFYLKRDYKEKKEAR